VSTIFRCENPRGPPCESSLWHYVLYCESDKPVVYYMVLWGFFGLVVPPAAAFYLIWCIYYYATRPVPNPPHALDGQEPEAWVVFPLR